MGRRSVGPAGIGEAPASHQAEPYVSRCQQGGDWVADRDRLFRTTQQLRRFQYGPQPASTAYVTSKIGGGALPAGGTEGQVLMMVGGVATWVTMTIWDRATTSWDSGSAVWDGGSTVWYS